MFERLSKDDALDRVMSLVKKFDEHYTEFKSDNYKELQVRSDFIDELFIALGWDIKDLDEKGQPYRDVILEYGIQGKARHYSSDYCFRINGKPVFLVEAKKPSANFTQNKDFAFQIKNYSWNKKLFFSVITDFENLAIYQTKTKPSQNDDVSKGRVKLINYKDYEKEFDLIYDMLSYEKVSSTEYEKIVMDFTHRKGIVEIDQDLLKTVESWRIILAKNISLRNPDFAYIKDINIAVQRIIDRLIFFRIAEDRDIEEHETLLQFALSSNIYGELKKLFKQCNEKYNSGLFASIEFIDNLNIDDDVLKTIIKQMYKPECQYAWNVLPIDILGKVYEKFLGSEIHFRNVSNGKTVVVEQKELVRKAGGVYYTPQYIVDYIVSKTIGEKLKNATPKTILSFRICDIACGSGSFLIEAYNAMLEWYLQYYTKKEKNNALKKGLIREYAIEGSIEKKYCLTIEEKKRILTTHIYGVDIDELAVEVTKLSLYIQLLNDDEMENTLIKESDLHILPDLSSNIQCGNSLIDEDFYIKYPDVTQDIISEVKPFSFEKKFCKVFEEGGFDVIIGNPPYVSSNNQKEFSILAIQRTYLDSSNYYQTLHEKYDIYVAFVEKSLRLLNKNGLYGAILPYPVTNQKYGMKLRKEVLNNYNLIEVCDLSKKKIFGDATVSNCLMFVENSKSQNNTRISTISDGYMIYPLVSKKSRDLIFDDKNYVFNLTKATNELYKYKDLHVLGDYCYISKGMVLNADEKTAKGKFKKEDLISNTKDNIHCKRFIEGKDCGKYTVNRVRYLEYNTKRIPKQLSRKTFSELYSTSKLMFNRLGELQVFFDEVGDFATSDAMFVCLTWNSLKDVENKSISTSIKKYSKMSRQEMEKLSETVDLKYLLGIMNSRYVSLLLSNIRGGDYHIYPEYIRNIPIPTATHEQQSYIIERVENIIKFKSMLTECSLTDKALYETKVSDLENDIDQTVYKLYGLNAKDIASVEKSLAG